MTDHANELRRHARKIPHPQCETPGVMLRAADEIERLQSVIAGLRADFETAHARMMTSAAAEREACAQVCDEYAANSSNPMNFSENCAAAIRARGEK